MNFSRLSTSGHLLSAFLIVLLSCAGNPAIGQPAANPSVRTSGLIMVSYQKAPIATVIDLLEQLSGKHFVRDANLDGIPPISVNVEGLSKEDSIRLITATLLLNGVAVLPVDDHTMKVVTTGTNKNPRSEGLHVYTTAADLPADDEIVTYYMALDHINPQEAAGLFTQVAPVHVYGAYVPAPSAQGIILTENASVIRELIELKKSIDVVKEPNVRLPPDAPDRSEAHPPGPPHHHHPLMCLVGFLLLSGFLVVIVAAGNVLAHRWMNRGKPAAR